MKPDPALLAEWEAKLKAEGLGDLDERVKGGIRVKRGGDLDPARAVEYQAASDYYTSAERCLDEITDPDDHAVWLLHAQGWTSQEIVEQIGETLPALVTLTDRDRRVRNVISRLCRRFKLRPRG